MEPTLRGEIESVRGTIVEVRFEGALPRIGAGFVCRAPGRKEVTGEVRIRLYKGVADATGRRSDSSLYRQDLATFGEGMAYDHADAGGFIARTRVRTASR